MKRTKEDAEQTKQAILTAALNVFSAKGYSRATLSDIAREADVTRGAIYWHFHDKAGLFHELCLSIHKNLWERNQEIFERYPDPENRIRYSIINALTVMQQNPNVYKMHEIIYRTDFGDLVRLKEEGAKYFGRIFHLYRDEVQKGIEQGLFSADTDADKATFYLFGTVNGLRSMWVFFQEQFSLTDTAEYTAELILCGIKKFDKENLCENNG